MMKRVLSFVLAIVLTMGLALLSPPVEAQAMSTMSPSEEVANYLKETEGFNPVPVWDYSQWTVGFGTRCPDEHFERYSTEGIPILEAHALFASSLAGVANRVNQMMERKGITLKQHQFDALVCLTYNKGSNWLTMENEPVIVALLEGDTGNKLVAALSLTSYAGGNFMPALMRRRLVEADMFINGNYNKSPAESFCYVRYDGNGGEVSRTVQGYTVDLPVQFYCTATYEGHTFLGWFTEPEGGEQITELNKDCNEMTLYAHWAEGAEDVPFEPIQVTIETYELNIRNKPGTHHSVVGAVYQGEVYTLLAIQEEEGMPWGLIEGGWINLSYTDYRVPINPVEPKPPVDDTPVQPDDEKPPVVEEEKDATFPDGLPLTGTVVGTNTLNVYNGPHNGYPRVSTLAPGDRVTVLETYELLGILWGRTESGWVRMDHCILFDGYKLLAHSFTATITTNGLSVRSGPGTEFTRIAYANYGQKLTITAIVVVAGRHWGMFEGGWVSLEYSDYDSDLLSHYQEHVMGQWYVFQVASCTQQGVERRDCTHCDGYEERVTDYEPHTYGPWTDSREATCVQPGQQQRECTACGHRETRNTSVSGHECGPWELVSPATCAKPGQERRDCVHCDYYESRVTPLADHSFGNWYVAKEPTDLETGLERRDCLHCDHYEEKILPVTEHVYGDWYVSLAPTCTAEGIERRDCLHCEHYQQRSVSANGHTMSGWEQVKAPTCVAEGTEKRVCRYCDHEESRAIAATGEHSFGTWQTVTEATTTQEGVERRDCLHCNHYETRSIPCKPAAVEKTYGTLTGWHYVNVRKGPGTNYGKVTTLNYGDRVEILEQTDVGGILWGRYEDGWVCITDYLTLETVREEVEVPSEPEQPSKPPVTTVTKTYGTLTGWHYVNVRAGAGTGYAKITTLNYGDRVEILEQASVGGILWGRYEVGWVCITDYLTLETVEEEVETPVEPSEPAEPEIPEEPEQPAEPEKPAEPVTKTFGTLTGWSYLNVRQGPGTGYAQVGTLRYGDRVEILERTMVGSIEWGRYEGGWVCITDYLTLTTVTEEPDVSVPSKPEIPEQGETVKKTFATVTTNALSLRQGPGTNYGRTGFLYYGTRVEITQQTTVNGILWGKCEQGWICLTDYTSLETEEVEEKEQVVMIVATDVLNVRSGAGLNYGIVTAIYSGTRVVVLEEKYVDNRTWVKIDQGWCAKEYLTTSN